MQLLITQLLMAQFQDRFKIFLKKYRNQCITDYLTEQHENANHVYTQTDPNPVTEEEIKNPLLVVAREEKLVRVKMGLFEEDLQKIKSLQESSCLTNYYRKTIEDMEKELSLDGMELAALENEMKLNGSSIEIEKVRQFFNEIDEEKR